MAIPFEFYQNPNPDPDAPARYHARVVTKGTLTLKDIVDTVSGRSTLSAADVHAAVTALEEVISENLAQGYRVHLDGLGSFSLSLSAPEVDDPKKVRAPKISAKSVNFGADKTFVAHSQRFGFERSAEKPHSAQVTGEEIRASIVNFLETHPFIRRTDIERNLGLTRSTAQRAIKQLLEDGFLANMSGDAHHPLYVLVTKK